MATDSAITVQNLSKLFDVGARRGRSFAAVEGISFDVRRNTLFGFLGPNGAGKTTTIKMMTGLIFPSNGEISILGGSPQNRQVRAQFGYLPENPSFPDHLTGAEYLRFSCQLLRIPRKRIQDEVDRTLNATDLKRAERLQIRKFSKGMAQRLGIAQALLGNPEVIILDEPMSGLDPIGRRDIKDLILDLRQKGKTVFFSTHIISDVEEICDDVAIVVNGKVAKQGRVAELIDSSTRELEITARGLPEQFAGRMDGAGAVSRLLVKNEAELRSTMERIWAASGTVTGVRARHYGLEEIFLQEVRKEPNRAPLGGQP